MNENYHVSASPHIRDKIKSSNIMLLVVIALLPATVFGIWNFRHENAWILVVATTAAAVLAEYIYEKLTCIESSSDASVVDGGTRSRICNRCCKTAFRWIGTKFYESGLSCKMLSSNLFYAKNDVFCV